MFRHSRPRTRGTMVLEMAVIAPVILAFLAFTIAAGRFVNTKQGLASNARDAARFASQQRSEADARDAVNRVVEQMKSGAVGDLPQRCRNTLRASNSTYDYVRGGSVTIIFECQINYKDLFNFGISGDVNMRATAISAVDKYWGVRDDDGGH